MTLRGPSALPPSALLLSSCLKCGRASAVPGGITVRPQSSWGRAGTRRFLLEEETQGLAAAEQFKCKCFPTDTQGKELNSELRGYSCSPNPWPGASLPGVCPSWLSSLGSAHARTASCFLAWVSHCGRILSENHGILDVSIRPDPGC